MRKLCRRDVMKRYVKILFVICFFTFYPTNTHANEQLFVSAEHAILFEQSTGNILFEKNAHEKTSVASITKVMTAIIALEYGGFVILIAMLIILPYFFG